MSRGAWILVSLVVVLGGYYAWDLRSEKQETAKKEESSRLFPLPADQINELVFEFQGRRTVLQKTIDGWKLTEPLEDFADSEFVDDFVARTTQDRSLEVAVSGADLNWALYGLDQPLGKITLKSQKGETITLEVSEKTNFEQQGLGRISGQNQVLVIPSIWKSTIAKGSLDFRDKRFLRHRIASIERLEVENSRGRLEVEQKEGKWVAPRHSDWELDQNRVRELLTQINETRAVDFLSNQLPTTAEKKKYFLEKPKVRLKAKLKEQDWLAEIGAGPQQEAYASVSFPPFTLKLDGAALQKFEQLELDGLREKKSAFDFGKDLARAIEIETPLKKNAFTKSGETWSLQGGSETHEADTEKLSQFVGKLHELRVGRYPSPALKKDFKEEGRIRLKDEAQAVLFELVWGPRTTMKIHGETFQYRQAKTNKRDESFWLEDSMLQGLELESLVKEKAPPATKANL